MTAAELKEAAETSSSVEIIAIITASKTSLWCEQSMHDYRCGWTSVSPSSSPK